MSAPATASRPNIYRRAGCSNVVIHGFHSKISEEQNRNKRDSSDKRQSCDNSAVRVDYAKIKEVLSHELDGSHHAFHPCDPRASWL